MSTADRSEKLTGKSLVPIRCSSCGGLLSFQGQDPIHCDYCGTDFVMDLSSIGSGESDNKQIQHYYELAACSQAGDSSDEAYDFYTRILELDSNQELAWYGRGLSALGRTTGIRIDSKLAIACFERAIDRAPEDQVEQLEKQVATTCFHYASMIYAWYKRNNWFTYTSLSSLVSLIKFSDRIVPKNPNELAWIVSILCEQRKVVDYSKLIRELTLRIRKEVPSYRNPIEIEKRNQAIAITFGVIGAIAVVVLIFYLLANKYN